MSTYIVSGAIPLDTHLRCLQLRLLVLIDELESTEGSNARQFCLCWSVDKKA